MKVAFLVLSLIALVVSGCGNKDAADHTRYQYAVDQAGVDGLVLRASKDMCVTFEQVQQYYRETEACVGASAAIGPTVAFDSFHRIGLGGGWGVHVPVSRYIIINTDEDPLFPRDGSTDRQALQHEFVHYLLTESGLPDEQNAAHDSPYFAKCGPGVNTSH